MVAGTWPAFGSCAKRRAARIAAAMRITRLRPSSTAAILHSSPFVCLSRSGYFARRTGLQLRCGHVFAPTGRSVCRPLHSIVAKIRVVKLLTRLIFEVAPAWDQDLKRMLAAFLKTGSILLQSDSGFGVVTNDVAEILFMAVGDDSVRLDAPIS